ncbi:exported hypothetical protein [Candidatus Sulfopaludibacter sp. SbA3]|nr:exported hypothetical protein [Candidatus Sulfopaludibacter sp. SbA3]
MIKPETRQASPAKKSFILRPLVAVALSGGIVLAWVYFDSFVYPAVLTCLWFTVLVLVVRRRAPGKQVASSGPEVRHSALSRFFRELVRLDREKNWGG